LIFVSAGGPAFTGITFYILTNKQQQMYLHKTVSANVFVALVLNCWTTYDQFWISRRTFMLNPD